MDQDILAFLTIFGGQNFPVQAVQFPQRPWAFEGEIPFPGNRALVEHHHQSAAFIQPQSSGPQKFRAGKQRRRAGALVHLCQLCPNLLRHMPAGRNYHMPITGVADAQRPLRKLGSQNGLVVNVIEINPSLLQRLARGPESRFCRPGGGVVCQIIPVRGIQGGVRGGNPGLQKELRPGQIAVQGLHVLRPGNFRGIAGAHVQRRRPLAAGGHVHVVDQRYAPHKLEIGQISGLIPGKSRSIDVKGFAETAGLADLPGGGSADSGEEPEARGLGLGLHVRADQLPPDQVDPRQIQPPQTGQGAAISAMQRPEGVVLVVQMAAQHHAVASTPVSDGFQKILPEKLAAKAVIINSGSNVRCRCGQPAVVYRGQVFQNRIAVPFLKPFRHVPWPGSAPCARLVGEEVEPVLDEVGKCPGVFFMGFFKKGPGVLRVQRLSQPAKGLIFPVIFLNFRVLFGPVSRGDGPALRKGGNYVVRRAIDRPRSQKRVAPFQYRPHPAGILGNQQIPRTAGGPAPLVIQPEIHVPLPGLLGRKANQPEKRVRQVSGFQPRPQPLGAKIHGHGNDVYAANAHLEHLVQLPADDLLGNGAVPGPGVNRLIFPGRRKKFFGKKGVHECLLTSVSIK